MSLSSKEVFKSLREEGHPLFLSYFLAFSLLGAPSERALRMAVRRGKCPIPEREGPTAGKCFSLADIACFLAGEEVKEDKKPHRRPTKSEEIAAREGK